ncbi:MAG: ribulose-phosphate 3-epimerase [bacterium]|nr:ribulose-phosphate 3-epimerase [bacterium]
MPSNSKKTTFSIIPAILAHSRAEFLEKLEIIRKSSPKPKLLQIDVVDGKFVDNTTWGTPAQIKALQLDIPFEAHLMVNNPEKAYKRWITAGANRVVFHYEATKDPIGLAKGIRIAGAKPIMAINPETNINIDPLIFKVINGILVMDIHPGFGGQKMLPGTFKKIRALRKAHPHLKIEVDGGVNAKNMQKLIDAGANELVIGSAYYS